MTTMGMPSRAAVFLDRDGTVNEDRGYVTALDQFVLLPGVDEAIARLNQFGFLVIVVTNQSAIGRGLMTEGDLDLLHHHLDRRLNIVGAHVDAYYHCPHHPQDGCECRKPKPGMIRQALQEFSLEPGRCVFLGDKQSDLEAANAGGVAGVLVKTSPYADQALAAFHAGLLPITFVADSFAQAVDWILQRSEPCSKR
jgi:histidinol-phosphate phosphatase family protein